MQGWRNTEEASPFLQLLLLLPFWKALDVTVSAPEVSSVIAASDAVNAATVLALVVSSVGHKSSANAIVLLAVDSTFSDGLSPAI